MKELIQALINQGIITATDIQRMTTLELLLSIVERVNELHGLTNEGLVAVQRLLDEGVQEEVVAQLDEWLQDGTFDTLINQSALKKVNDSLVETNTQLSHITTKSSGFVNIKTYENLVDNNDWTRAINQALLDMGGSGKLFFPNGEYCISEPIIVEGASHYTKVGITIEGESKGGVIIKANSNIPLESVISLNPSQRNGYNITIEKLYINHNNLAHTGLSFDGQIAKSSFKDLIISGEEYGCHVKEDMWQNKFENLMIYGNRKGFIMEKHGTSNSFTTCFVYGTREIGWLLTGTYSFADNLACDGNEGISYCFRFCDFVVGSLGSESNTLEKFIEVTNGRVSVGNATLFTSGLTNEFCGLYGHNGALSVDFYVINSNASLTTGGKLYDTGSLFELRINSISNENVTFIGTKTEGDYSDNIVTLGGLSYRVDGTRNVRAFVGNSLGVRKTQPNQPFIAYDRSITWCDNNPSEVDGANFEWSKPFNQGTLFISTTPNKSNVAGFIRYDNEEINFNRDGKYMRVPVILSGTTEERPVTNIYVGLQYFDTTLGKPIWIKWADGSGTWVDADGNEV